MRWKPQYSAYLLSRMGLDARLRDGELRRAQVEALIGRAATDALFPDRTRQSRNRSSRTASTRRDSISRNFRRRSRPTAASSPPRRISNGPPRGSHPPPAATREFALGSNNWAVSPRRTAAGHALLEGDPHLSLSMPSVWYEEHLVVPDTIDAYGVGFVGAPFIAIGFNRDVAWTETNTAADVADYYVETVDNDAHPSKYKLDGAWKPLEVRIEIVRDRAGTALATDTIYHTHRGPMLRAGTQWVSRRWTVLEPNDASGVFARAAMAHSSAELFKAFDSLRSARAERAHRGSRRAYRHPFDRTLSDSPEVRAAR